jgi:hypothetical protein
MGTGKADSEPPFPADGIKVRLYKGDEPLAADIAEKLPQHDDDPGYFLIVVLFEYSLFRTLPEISTHG